MKKILRIVGSNLYVERADYYMDELEKATFTHDPAEALDCTDMLAPEYEGLVVEALVEWVRDANDSLLEVVEVL